MHLSEGILSGPVLLSGAALAAAGTAVGLKQLDYDRIARTGILSAAFFCGIIDSCSLGSHQRPPDIERYCRAFARVGRLSGNFDRAASSGAVFSVRRAYHAWHQHPYYGAAGCDLLLSFFSIYQW